tara:strand:+ start:9842 stop:10471 length:630 start_codon:yes stop_codon:yes gene_type:complete
MTVKEDLRTGDLILFHSKESGLLGIFNSLIEYFTGSPYDHIGMILKDPIYINEKLTGLYVWESGLEYNPDIEDNKYKLGVQITPLEEILKSNNGSAFIRELKCTDELYNSTFTETKLKEIHDVVYNKPYDINPKDWILAIFRRDTEPQKTNRFWCSALVGYIYTKLGILEENTDWSILRPSDFSMESRDEYIDLKDGFKLDDEQIEILN